MSIVLLIQYLFFINARWSHLLFIWVCIWSYKFLFNLMHQSAANNALSLRLQSLPHQARIHYLHFLYVPSHHSINRSCCGCLEEKYFCFPNFSQPTRIYKFTPTLRKWDGKLERDLKSWMETVFAEKTLSDFYKISWGLTLLGILCPRKMLKPLILKNKNERLEHLLWVY